MKPAAGQIAQMLSQALAHHQAGRIASALPLYRQAQRLAPQSFDAWNLGGTASLQTGAAEDARAQLVRALQLKPDSGIALLRLGIACAALARLDEAADLLRRAAVKSPGAPEPFEHLAVVERRRGRMPEAIQAAQALCGLRPDSAEAFFRVCHLVAAARGIAAALPLLEDATRRWPDNAEAWKNLGTAQANLHRAPDALASLERAAALRPELPGIDLGLGLARQESGLIAQAVECYERVLRSDPAHPEAGSARLLCLNYLETASAVSIAEAARAYGATRTCRAAWSAPAPAAPDKRPLRVAVVSPDLRKHAVAQFFQPIVDNLPAGVLELWLYHDHPVEDAVSAALKNRAARWSNLAGLPHEQVRDRIRADAPDILVDLAAHTGFNRLPVFAERVAPVQITYLGYPGSTGLTEMDYRLTDAVADPEGATDSLHTEKLVRFSPCAWAFQPPADTPPVSVPESGENRPVVFGSFNTPAKLSAFTLRLWSRVLAATPGSRLLLKGHGFDDVRVTRDWLARLDASGISADRVDLVGRISSSGGHLALYGRVDIALDPFPYHGTTTTCEALWMGRPVVTLAGADHRSRVGASLLHAAGHSEWIAGDEDEYVRIATQLALAPALRREIALGMRASLERSSLCDHAGRASDFASALLACHREKIVGLV